MRIRRPENITDEQYKRYLIRISELMLDNIHKRSKNMDFLSYSEREYINNILIPIITASPITENIYKLADISLAIKQLKSPRHKQMKEFSDMIYDAHLALHTLNIISANISETKSIATTTTIQ